MKCMQCGQELAEDARVCPICKCKQNVIPLRGGEYTFNRLRRKAYPYAPRSRVVAGLLQIFFGGFGIGRFYLGYNAIAIGQVFTFPIFFIGGIWGVIDGILILCGQVSHDANGVPII